MKRLFALAVCALLVGACGGGGGSPEDQVAEQYNGFLSDIKDKKFEAACERTSPNYQKQIVEAGKLLKAGDSCEKVLKSIVASDKDATKELEKEPEAKASNVTINGDKAIVKVGDDTAAFVKRDDKWLVDGDAGTGSG